jgi:hypothetical protein
MIRFWSAVWLAALLAPVAAASTPLGTSQDKSDGGAPEAFTFLFWTDQELDPGKETKLTPHVDAMNAMGGKTLPPPLGTKLEKPDFVASAGDSTGWPSHGAVQAWNKVVREMLKIPTRAVAGNHDSGGAEPANCSTVAPLGSVREGPSSDNGLAAWKPPGVRHLPASLLLPPQGRRLLSPPSPTYDLGNPAGSLSLLQTDVSG